MLSKSARGAANQLVYLSGLSGSGKSTVARATMTLVGAGTLNHVEFSSLLARELHQAPNEWDSASDEEFAKAGGCAAETLLTKLPALVTGHVFASRNSGRLVLDEAWGDILPCISVVMLQVHPDILTLRAARRGTTFSPAQFADDWLFAKHYAASKCRAKRTPLHILQNNEEDAIGANAKILAQLFGGIA